MSSAKQERLELLLAGGFDVTTLDVDLLRLTAD